MPAESKKQEMFMQAVANNPEFAKKVGVKQSIGQEFTKEKDMKKVKKMQMGGEQLMMSVPEQWILEWRWRWKHEDALLLVGGMKEWWYRLKKVEHEKTASLIATNVMVLHKRAILKGRWCNHGERF
jgi:hypothetical protein